MLGPSSTHDRFSVMHRTECSSPHAPAHAATLPCANLVSMTRHADPTKLKTPKARGPARAGYWLLQDAKSRFSELVRRVRSEGPQHVTVHGREAVVVVAAEEFRRLRGEPTGQALVDALQASPHPEVDLALPRSPMPVRDVSL